MDITGPVTFFQVPDIQNRKSCTCYHSAYDITVYDTVAEPLKKLAAQFEVEKEDSFLNQTLFSHAQIYLAKKRDSGPNPIPRPHAPLGNSHHKSAIQHFAPVYLFSALQPWCREI